MPPTAVLRSRQVVAIKETRRWAVRFSLPPAIRSLVGTLDDGWRDEARSDCANCPMVHAHDAGITHPFSTGPETRCCTAQPNLASFLVGRALADPASTAVIHATRGSRIC